MSIERYKLLAKIKHKYSTLLDFDKNRRSLYRVQNYVKRHLLKEPLNMMKEDINDIPGVYRYRTVIENNEDRDNINEMFELYYLELENITDPDIKKVERTQIDEQKKYILNEMKTNTQKYDILVDLRIHGINPETPIYINGKQFALSKKDKETVVEIYKKVNESNPNGERFIQMLKWSKELCNTYKEIIEPKKIVAKNA